MPHPRTKSGPPDPPAQAATPAHAREFVLDAFDRYERQLTSYALKYYGGTHGNLDAARDAVQFTFLKLCQQSPAAIACKLAPWLYTVCRNRILDDLKKQNKQRFVADLGDTQLGTDFDPADACQRNELFDRLPSILASLPVNEREVVELWSEGLKPKEIAEVLDRPPGTIRVQLHRAIQSMKQHPEIQPWLERATSCSENPGRQELPTTRYQRRCKTMNDKQRSSNDEPNRDPNPANEKQLAEQTVRVLELRPLEDQTQNSQSQDDQATAELGQLLRDAAKANLPDSNLDLQDLLWPSLMADRQPRKPIK